MPSNITTKTPINIDSFLINAELLNLEDIDTSVESNLNNENSATTTKPIVKNNITSENPNTTIGSTSSTTEKITYHYITGKPKQKTTSTRQIPSTTTTTTTTKTTETSSTSESKLTDNLNNFDLDDLVQLFSAQHQLLEEQQLQATTVENNKTSDELEKIYANRHAQKLLLSGVQLVENSIDDEFGTTTSTTTIKPTIKAENEQTSTEMVTEVNAVETRVRNTHRRFNMQRSRATTTTTKAATIPITINPLIRRANLRRNLTATTEAGSIITTTTTTTTTPTTLRPTFKRQQHQHHQHHHHHHHHTQRHRQRGKAKTVTTTTSSTTTTEAGALLLPTDSTNSNDLNRRLSVRNIDKANAHGNSFTTEKYSARYNRRKTSTTAATIATTTNKPWSQRNRQTVLRSRVTNNNNSVAKTTTTTEIEKIIAKDITVTPLNVSLINTINSVPNTTTSFSTSTSIASSSSSTSTSSSFNPNPNTNTSTLFIQENDSKNNNSKKIQEPIDNIQFLPFDELTRAIVDTSFLQNYHHKNKQQQQKQQYILPTAATISAAKLTAPIFTTTTAPTPVKTVNQAARVLIARAEEQRNNNQLKVPALHFLSTQLQAKTATTTVAAYVPLDDFLNNKFGKNSAIAATTNTAAAAAAKTHYFGKNANNNIFQQKPQQMQKYYEIVPSIQQQQQQQQKFYQPPTQQQNVYYNLQQQQQQLPIFSGNLALASTQTNTHIEPNSLPKNNANNFNSFSNGAVVTNSYFNVKLPALAAGLIPAAYTPLAQRRADDFQFELDTTPQSRAHLFSGVTSYDVPLSSVGRLTNDITQRLRSYKK